MRATAEKLTEPLIWPEEGVTRVPFRLFSDPEIYELEQERIFNGPVWHYLCLEIDVPNLGDFKTTSIGEVPVVVTRDESGTLHAMVNRCAHKGALVCLKESGNARDLTCAYHSWSYDMSGQLQSIAFRKGLNGSGGMPEDFDPAKHRLQPVRIENFYGLIFGTFDRTIGSVEGYLGSEMSRLIRRNFEGHRLKHLGMHSQIIHNNWKLYAENLRDSYHATILHTFYTTFNVNRLDMDGGIVLAEDKWHHCSYAKRATVRNAAEYKDVHSAQYNSKLKGPHLLDSIEEGDDGITHMIQAIFPSVCVQFTLNSLAVRFYQPRGPEETELFWIYLGYEDDGEEMTQRRLRQSNLTGAAGLVSLEDGRINEFVQRGVRGSGDVNAFLEMGGRDVEPSETSRATEVAIRGFWTGYRRCMGFD